MPSQIRHETGKEGVYYILTARTKNSKKKNDGTQPVKLEKTFYISYRLGNRKIEEKVGRESEAMTATKAARIRLERKLGLSQPNTERRRIQKKKELTEKSSWTINKLWDAYKAYNPMLKGIVTDENRFEKHIKKPFGKLTPDQINTRMVDNLRIKLFKEGKKPGTVKNILEMLRRLINFGVRKGYCDWQPPSRLHFEMPKLNNLKTEFLTSAERTRFIKAAKEYPNKKAGRIMLVAYYTGMRRNEIFGLKWRHVDFENGFINIVGEGQEGAKSSRDERIPLTQPVRELFDEAREGNESEYIFPGKDGISRLTDIHKMANEIKVAARLPKDFRPMHGLRHTFASVAVSNGVPLSHVQKLLTHKDPSLTQRYAHLEDRALLNSANIVGSLLSDALIEKV